MSWTPFITAAGSILAAFAGAALAAHFGFKRWREQRWFERREHLAEQVLADFYDVRIVFRWVRSPGAFGGEGETRPRPKQEEPPGLERLRNAYFAPIERIKAQKELFARLAVARFRFMALFGVGAAAPFEKIQKVQTDIVFAAQELIEEAGHEQDETTTKNKRTIWWRTDTRDEITKVIEEAVGQIETICQPILEAKRPPR